MKKNRTFKNFSDWHSFDIREKLGYNLSLKSEALTRWINVSGKIPEEYHKPLTLIRIELFEYGADWNETELQMKFIAPFLLTVDFKGKGFYSFAERTLEGQIRNYKVKGVVDWMAASGSYEPETPYFFIHEYKKFKGTDADPLGQLLISMVAAKELNADGLAVYGCYIIGKFWHFVLLEGETYSVSEGYDVTDEGEMTTVWLILNKTKTIIAQRAAQDAEKNKN